MATSILLRGYRYSVYNRIVRLALLEKGVSFQVEEVDPFAADLPASFLQLNPFGRVPVLTHGDFHIYETAAIERYIDAAFDGPALSPVNPKALGQMTQVVSIIDSYGYWPMVRQVFAHRVFHKLAGEPVDEQEIQEGIQASHTVLGALDALAGAGYVLNGEEFTLADCHLAPVVAYFVQAPEGAEALKAYSNLVKWWETVINRKTFRATEPGLPDKH